MVGKISLAGPGKRPRKIISEDCTTSSFELQRWWKGGI